MSRTLAGKAAVVTGASRGLGQIIAQALAAQGARVALVGRDKSRLNQTAKTIREAGGDARPFAADIRSAEAVERLAADVTASLGSISILVNAAGVFGPIQLIKDSDPIAWIETLQTNTIAPYLLCRAFVGGMIERGWGRVINVTSAAALHTPGPLNSAYATSKVAVNQFTRHLAAELDGTGVTANVFHPGDVKTDMWASIHDDVEKLGPDGEAYRQWVRWVEQTGGDPPEKAAELVIKLVSSDAASINGQFLWIEGGLQAPIPSWDAPTVARPWD